MRRASSLLLAAVMTLSTVAQPIQAGAAGVKAQQEYEIYPIPHSVVYENGDYALNQEINVVYEDGVDEATKARVREIAALKDLTLVEQTAAQNGETNLLIGIAGDKDTTVDTYMNEKQLMDQATLAKNDGYVLSSKDGTIAILGKDADASFYGATTLYHVVNQLEAQSIRNFLIKDFSDVVSRGFIEGYYGNPWSTQDRINLMKWGGYYKLNSYFYAPKDDPKHNAQWKELYTKEEIETKIKPLAEAGNSSKCRFVFALHPYMHNAIRYDTEEHYQADMDAMKAKFAQVIEAGVRQIAILADDAGLKRPEEYKRTLDDMSAWLKEQQKTYPDLKLNLPFCVQEYMNGVPSLPEYYTTFPENVQLMVTGGAVWGDVYRNFSTPFKEKFGRGAYQWVNWPCSDNSKDNLVMDGYQVLHTDVEPGSMEGIVLNPMQQSEPSKVAIFGNACYAWNIWTEAERDQAYHDSFKYVDHNSAEETPASTALRELSKHMRNHRAGGYPRHEESQELAPKIADFKQKMTNGKLTAGDVDAMIAEFTVLQEAAKTFRAEGSKQLLGDIGKDYTAPEANEQMAPWIDTWDDLTVAAIQYLNAIKLTLTEDWDVNPVLAVYNDAQVAMNQADSHQFFYVNHMESAQVGRQHITPFVRTMARWLGEQIQTKIDPTVQKMTYITNVMEFENPNVGQLENMFDGDDTTGVTFTGYLYLKTGDYIGVKYSQPITLKNVRILMGANKNHFHHSRVEYTTDGKNWEPVNDQVYERPNSPTVPPIVIDDLNIPNVVGVRMVATADNNMDAWIEIFTFDVNAKQEVQPGAPEAYPIAADKVSVQNAVETGGSKAQLVDGAKNTELWLKKSAEGADRDSIPAGASVTVDLGAVKTVGSVYFAQGASQANDIIDQGVVEYKGETGDWVELGRLTGKTEQTVTAENPVDARYIRIKNTQDKKIWWRLSELTVFGPATGAASNENLFTNVDNADVTAKVTAGSAALTGAVTLKPGEYVGIDLGEIRALTAAALPAALKGATFQVSANNIIWSAETAEVMGLRARYVRFLNETDEDIQLNTDGFRLENQVIGQLGELLSDDIADWGWGDTAGNGAAFDGDVSTTTKFGGNPMQGNTAVYSLGRSMDIRSIRVYNADTECDYIRDCQIQLSKDGKNWETALTIGDGQIDTDRLTSFGSINDDAKKTDSNYPNKFYYGNDEVPANVGDGARFLRILITADYPERALVMNEIMLNKGEYLSPETNMAFQGTMEAPGHIPSFMLDKDLNTTYKPAAADGALTYALSDNKPVGTVRLVQIGAASNAVVTAQIVRNGVAQNVTLGMLSKAVNDFGIPADAQLVNITVSWGAKLPELSELILLAQTIEPEGPTEDELAAAAVNAKIDAIGTVTLASEQKITEARTAYDALTEAQKALVTKLDVLTAAEKKLAELKDEAAQAEKDKQLAAAVDAKIDAIGTVTLDSDKKIHAARVAYDNLTAAQKALVTKLEVLVAAEKTFADLNKPVEPEVSFPDVKPGDWFYKGVMYSAGKGLMNGLPDGTFGPAVTMTRAQLVQMLYAMEGKPTVASVTDKFSDVKAGDWFADAVTWAVEANVTGGVGEGTFAPNAKITRQEMAVMLYAYKSRPAAEGKLDFVDNADIADWAAKAVIWAVDNGLMSSTSTEQMMFSPKNTATRAEAAIIMMNLDKLAK